MSSTSFSLIDTAGLGYRRVWQERHYLLKLAVVPFFLHLIGGMLVAINGWQPLYIRQSLVLLPAFFAEGWMLAHFCRLIFLDQRWPFRPSGQAEADISELRHRARGIMGATVFFVLINLLAAGMLAVSTSLSAETVEAGRGPAAGQESSILVLVMAVALMAGLIWSVKLMWIYIPLAIEWPVREYMKVVPGLIGSLRLIMVATVCFLPPTFLYNLVVAIVAGPYMGGAMPAILQFLLSLLSTALQILVALLITAGISETLRRMVTTGEKGKFF